MLSSLILMCFVSCDYHQMSLATLRVASAQHCSLTLLYLRQSQDVHAAVSLPPMELQAFVVTLR